MNFQELGDEIELHDIENPEDTENTIRFDFTFKNANDVKDFLISNRLLKSNIQRLFAWLISFGIVKYDSSKWYDNIQTMFSDYQILIRTNLIDCEEDPLSSLDEQDASVVNADITRILSWFSDMAKSLAIPENQCRRAKTHAFRIIALLSQTKNFKYAQGHDRYVIIPYLLALNFTCRHNLSSEYAEAITYNLSYPLIQMRNISDYLDNPRQSQKYFEELDHLMEKLTPEHYNILKQFGQSSIHFALRWQLLIFSDEYKIESIFYIWDNVIIRRNNIDAFMNALCVTHLSQVPFPRGEQMMIETIQHFTEFNAPKAVSDAIALCGGDPYPYSQYSIILSLIILFICLVFIRYIF